MRVLFITILLTIHVSACSRYTDSSDQPPAVEPVEIVQEVAGYDFFWPISIAADSGLVFIADFRDSNIKVFNHQLTLLDSIGQHGEGPGEFKALIGIAANNGILAALNINPARISVYDYQGALLNDFPVDASRWGDIAVTDNGTIYLARSNRGSGKYITEYSIRGDSQREVMELPRDEDFYLEYTARLRLGMGSDGVFIVFEQNPRILNTGNMPFDITYDLSAGYPWIKRVIRRRERRWESHQSMSIITTFGGFAVLPDHLIIAGIGHDILVLNLRTKELNQISMGSLGYDFTNQHQTTHMKRASSLGSSSTGTQAHLANTYLDAVVVDDEIWMVSGMNSCLVRFSTQMILNTAKQGESMKQVDGERD